jgi:hypothetical protein
MGVSPCEVVPDCGDKICFAKIHPDLLFLYLYVDHSMDGCYVDCVPGASNSG